MLTRQRSFAELHRTSYMLSCVAAALFTNSLWLTAVSPSGAAVLHMIVKRTQSIANQ